MSEVSDELYLIVGHAIDVHNRLGTKLLENAYHRMLAGELRAARYEVEYKPTAYIDPHGQRIGPYIPDLRVRKGNVRVLIELKAEARKINNADRRQGHTYLTACPESQAILILNFGIFPLDQDRLYQPRSRRKEAGND